MRHKTAPTWLWNSKGETKLFQTQEEVDRAWEEEWFAPADFEEESSVLSDGKYKTKQELIDAVTFDKRYAGLKLSMRNSFKTMVEKLVNFEITNGLLDGEELPEE